VKNKSHCFTVNVGGSSAAAAVSCSLLISSCDAYQDLWPPYCALLSRYWPQRPLPTYLITETAAPAFPGVTALRLGSGLDWSSLLTRALHRLHTRYVLLTLEDFFLRSPVDTARVLHLLEVVRSADLRMLRLVPRPGPDVVKDRAAGWGLLAATAPYRASTQAAIWEVATLADLLVEGESAWEFELNGTERSRALPGFAAVRRPAIPSGHHVIERGQWFPWEAMRFRRMQIGVDLTARAVMPMTTAARWLGQKSARTLLAALPVSIQRVLKRALSTQPAGSARKL
jgi:hypothetical protein